MRMAITLVVLAVLGISPFSVAQDLNRSDPVALAKMVAPFLTERTVMIAHLDATRVDLTACATKFAEIMKTVDSDQPAERVQADVKQMGQAMQVARGWQAAFIKAGGRDLFAVCSLPDFPRRPPIAIVIAPLAEGADAGVISGLLLTGQAVAPAAGATEGDDTVATIGKAVVRGNKGTIERLKDLQAQPQPLIEKALAAAGDSAGQVVLIMTAEGRRFLANGLPPELPAELGGGSSAALTEGVQFAAIGVDAWPKPALQAVVQARDADTAKDLAAMLVRATQSLKAAKPGSAPLVKVGVFVLLATASGQPTVAGEQLILKPDSDQIRKAIDDSVIPLVKQERRQALRAMSASNENLILRACIMYQVDRNDWPANIDVATLKDYGMNERTLANPLQPSRKAGYTYIKPSAAPVNAADTLVLYEAFDEWKDGVNCGFADGHVEWIADKARFEKLLAAAQAERP